MCSKDRDSKWAFKWSLRATPSTHLLCLHRIENYLWRWQSSYHLPNHIIRNEFSSSASKVAQIYPIINHQSRICKHTLGFRFEIKLCFPGVKSLKVRSLAPLNLLYVRVTIWSERLKKNGSYHQNRRWSSGKMFWDLQSFPSSLKTLCANQRVNWDWRGSIARAHWSFDVKLQWLLKRSFEWEKM